MPPGLIQIRELRPEQGVAYLPPRAGHPPRRDPGLPSRAGWKGSLGVLAI